MRIFRIATAALVAFALWAPATGSTAAGTSTYHGRFTSVTYTCDEQTSSLPASGTWNVAITGKQVATATFNIFVGGVHHLAYGVPGQAVTTTGSGWSFQFMTQAGLLVVSWDGASFRYAFPEGYSFGDLTCAQVVYAGT